MVQSEEVRAAQIPSISRFWLEQRPFCEAQLLFPSLLLTNQGGKMANKKGSSSKKKSSGRKYGKAASKSVKSAMHRKKKGTLKSGKGGKGGKVKSRKQAIAIGLSEAREKGAKVPKKK
jgi:hypothetical protein